MEIRNTICYDASANHRGSGIAVNYNINSKILDKIGLTSTNSDKRESICDINRHLMIIPAYVELN